MEEKIAIILVLLLVLFVLYSRREDFRSVWSPLRPKLFSFYKSGGIAGLHDRIDVYTDREYFVYSDDYAKNQGKFDNYSFLKIVTMINQLKGAKNNNYCPAKGNDIITYVITIGKREITFSSFDCLAGDIFTGLKILDRLTYP